MADPTALFHPSSDADDRFEPTALTGGPWRPDHQHGGPPSALLGTVAERELDADQLIARISIELVRGVPLSTLTVTAVKRDVSRRVASITAEMHAGDQLVATASALALRMGELPEPLWRPDEAVALAGPDGTIVPPAWSSGDGLAFHRDAIEHRFVDGGFTKRGPADSWQRLRVPVIAEHEPTPLARVLAVADLGSGISAVYDYTSFGMINADLTLALTRPLAGDWVHLQAITRVNDHGTGLAVTQIGDEQGHVGVVTQSLLGLRTS